MGLLSDNFYFYDLPDIEIIKEKISSYSGLDIVLVHFSETEEGKADFNIEYKSFFNIEYKSLKGNANIEISTTLKGRKTNWNAVSLDKDNISIYGSSVYAESHPNIGYYLFKLICTVLLDMGGLDENGNLLSQTYKIPTWTREKWQGQQWIEKVTGRPDFWDKIIRKIQNWFDGE